MNRQTFEEEAVERRMFDGAELMVVPGTLRFGKGRSFLAQGVERLRTDRRRKFTLGGNPDRHAAGQTLSSQLPEDKCPPLPVGREGGTGGMSTLGGISPDAPSQPTSSLRSWRSGMGPVAQRVFKTCAVW